MEKLNVSVSFTFHLTVINYMGAIQCSRRTVCQFFCRMSEHRLWYFHILPILYSLSLSFALLFSLLSSTRITFTSNLRRKGQEFSTKNLFIDKQLRTADLLIVSISFRISLRLYLIIQQLMHVSWEGQA